jgi:hypothetical protein
MAMPPELYWIPPWPDSRPATLSISSMNENDAHLLGALDDHARDQVHNARRIRGQNAERRTTDAKGRVETRPFAFKEKPNRL